MRFDFDLGIYISFLKSKICLVRCLGITFLVKSEFGKSVKRKELYIYCGFLTMIDNAKNTTIGIDAVSAYLSHLDPISVSNDHKSVYT